MRRRDCIVMLCAGAAWPLTARAQHLAKPVIGFLHSGVAPGSSGFRVGLPRGLSEAGFVEGRDFLGEYRWAEGHSDRLPALAADLVQRGVKVIVTGGGPMPAVAAKAATSTIPIVFFTGFDPVKIGLVGSDNRPGANLTGFNLMIEETEQKRLSVLHQIAPRARVIAALCDPRGSIATDLLAQIKDAARSLAIELVVVNASDASGFDAAFAEATKLEAGALLVTSVELFTVSRPNRDRLVDLASKYRLPAMFSLRETAQSGGLASYAADTAEGYRQVGLYVARILKGERPGDLPIIQPTKFELAINLKTAKALGLTISPSLIAVADEVIE